jgi:hypothetical protein
MKIMDVISETGSLGSSDEASEEDDQGCDCG